jgi:hypothetical protein
MNKLLGELMLLFPVWPFATIGAAVLFYVRHRNRIEPTRRVPVGLYILGVIVAGTVVGGLCVMFGIRWGCSMPQSGNLWGLIGPGMVDSLQAQPRCWEGETRSRLR